MSEYFPEPKSLGGRVKVELDLSNYAAKTDLKKKDVYNAKVINIEDKIPDITNLATNTTHNAKINEVKDEIPSITNLARTAAVTTVGSEIPNLGNLVI